VTQRRLTDTQQGYAEKAMPLVRMVIASYLKRHPDLVDVAYRCDLDGTAEQAVCLAALTYNPEKAGVSAYFSVAIHRAVSKEVLARQTHERRMRTAWNLCKPHLNPHIERMKHRAVKALQMLSPYEKQLLEDHLIEGVTLERLGREQDLDRRTIRKRIKRAIDRLREAEKDLP
jgi:DNA-directed RNA polymerase specialized sigma24 family protein